MVKAAIFDLDGLLVDTEVVSYRILREILAQFGHPFALEEYTRAFCGKPERDNAAHLVEAYGLPWTAAEALERIFQREEELHAQGVALKPGARTLLDYLKKTGRKIALASSSTRDRAMALLDQHQIGGRFQAFVFAEDIVRGKPAPDVFWKACEKLGEAPEDCLVLEDSEAGVRAAHAAKIPVLCVPDLKRPPQPVLDLAAAVLPSLEEAVGYLSDQKG